MSFGFGKALDLLRDGGQVRREGWDANTLLRVSDMSDGTMLAAAGFIELITAQRSQSWRAGSGDLLAEDWTHADVATVTVDAIGVTIALPLNGQRFEIQASDWRALVQGARRLALTGDTPDWFDVP